MGAAIIIENNQAIIWGSHLIGTKVEAPDLRGGAALYSGRNAVEDKIFENFDYVKVGPYIESFGPLNSKTTNQRLYKVAHEADSYSLMDITSRFWHRGIDQNVQ